MMYVAAGLQFVRSTGYSLRFDSWSAMRNNLEFLQPCLKNCFSVFFVCHYFQVREFLRLFKQILNYSRSCCFFLSFPLFLQRNRYKLEKLPFVEVQRLSISLLSSLSNLYCLVDYQIKSQI